MVGLQISVGQKCVMEFDDRERTGKRAMAPLRVQQSCSRDSILRNIITPPYRIVYSNCCRAVMIECFGDMMTSTILPWLRNLFYLNPGEYHRTLWLLFAGNPVPNYIDGQHVTRMSTRAIGFHSQNYINEFRSRHFQATRREGKHGIAYKHTRRSKTLRKSYNEMQILFDFPRKLFSKIVVMCNRNIAHTRDI